MENILSYGASIEDVLRLELGLSEKEVAEILEELKEEK